MLFKMSTNSLLLIHENCRNWEYSAIFTTVWCAMKFFIVFYKSYRSTKDWKLKTKTLFFTTGHLSIIGGWKNTKKKNVCSALLFCVLNESFSTLVLLTLEVFIVGGCPAHSKIFSIPGFYATLYHKCASSSYHVKQKTLNYTITLHLPRLVTDK